MTQPSRLQADLTARILERVKEQGLGPGDRLAELTLARDLGVSRTPVRAALAGLAAQGILERRPNRGYALRLPAERVEPPRALEAEADERLYLAIARDRLDGSLTDAFSEADLIRRYGIARPVLVRVLRRMANVGLVERKPGYGWRFLPAIDSAAARAESYRFRMIVEPAALLEPEFRLDPAWAARMREEHRATLSGPWGETSSIAFYDMNAAFHEGLAAASGNRFLLMAVQQQNRLRRFTNYDWRYGRERVEVNCREHMEILDRIEAGEAELAALLMRRHLERASQLRRSFGAVAA